MNKKPIALTTSKAYTSFLSERDHAAEDILFKYQKALSNVVSVLKQRSLEIAAYMTTKNIGRQHAKANRDTFEKRLEPWFRAGIDQSIALITKMRASVHILSYVSSAEAIKRALNKKTTVNATRNKVDAHKARKTVSGGDLHQTIELAFDRLKKNIIDAYQLSQVLESSSQDTLERIERAFPKSKTVQRPVKMAKLKEAGRDHRDDEDYTYEDFTNEQGVGASVIDSETWNQMVEDYTLDQLPPRGPHDLVFGSVEEPISDSFEGYAWQVEQETMNDFIESVRQGDNAAAVEQGIVDFVWIAITDSKTDDCCDVRDGLTTTEILEKLDAGEDMGDCDAVTPPAHFNCRCRASPADIEMSDTPRPSSDFPGFQDWLDNAG